MNLLKAEPVAVVNVVRLIALAAITFGLKLTVMQLSASLVALEAVLTLFTRSQVTSAATTANQQAASRGQGV